MKNFLFCCALVVLFQGNVDAQEKLKTLSGTLLTVTGEINDDKVPALPAKFWAKDNKMRMEITVGQMTSVSIQDGNTIYTFMKGENLNGTKIVVEEGLGSMGLIRQIETVRTKGRREEANEINGEVATRYVYDVNAPREMTVVFFSAETTLPRVWISIVQTGKEEAEGIQMFFRDLVANKDIDSSLFDIPKDIKFELVKSSGLFNPGKTEKQGRPTKKNFDVKSESSSQLHCVYEVSKHQVNDGRKKVGESQELAFYLNSEGYVVDTQPFVEDSMQRKIIYHRPSNSITELDRVAKRFQVMPAAGLVHFKVYELMHRIGTCRFLEASGLPQVMACTRLELESALGVAAPQFFPVGQELDVKESVRDGTHLFDAEGDTFGRFTPSNNKLTPEMTRSLGNILAHWLMVHPSMRESITSSKSIPKSFSIHIKEYQRDGKSEAFELVYELKSVQETSLPNWNVIPGHYRESQQHLTEQVVTILSQFRNVKQPSRSEFLASTKEQVESLLKKDKDCAALASAFRYFDRTGDEREYANLVAQIRKGENSLVLKFLADRFEQSDFEELSKVVEQQDNQLSAVTEYLLADTAMGQGWEVDLQSLLISALEKDPLLVGGYLDLGRILNDQFEMPSGWMCFSIARKISPDHPNLKIIDDLVDSLRRDCPDHF